MTDAENDTEGAPNEAPRRNTTGPLAIVGPNGERLRNWLRIVMGMGVLLVGDIFLYSHHQALQARVENQERRFIRLNKVVDDLLMTNTNAEKIEKIELQVDGIDGQVQELTDVIKAQDAIPEEPAPKKKKR